MKANRYLDARLVILAAAILAAASCGWSDCGSIPFYSPFLIDLDIETTEDSRPALTDKGIYNEIVDTLTIRNPKYENAMDFTIDTVKHDINEVCRIIMDMLNLKTRQEG